MEVGYIDHVLFLIQKLKTNRTLQNLTVHVLKQRIHNRRNDTRQHRASSQEFNNEVIAMLKDNAILSNLDIVGWRKPKLAQYYLLLNRAGRAKLEGNWEGAQESDWVEAVVKCARNVSGLYFFLRLNPAILYGSRLPGPPSGKQNGKKRKRNQEQSPS